MRHFVAKCSVLGLAILGAAYFCAPALAESLPDPKNVLLLSNPPIIKERPILPALLSNSPVQIRGGKFFIRAYSIGDAPKSDRSGSAVKTEFLIGIAHGKTIMPQVKISF